MDLNESNEADANFFATGLSGTNSVSAYLVGYTGTAATNPISIDDGNGFTLDSLMLNGSATVTNGVLQLTGNQASRAGSAYYPTQVPTSSFTTDLAFQLLDPLADGITFTIQDNGPNAIGSVGDGLGYQGIAKSIALKFDQGTNSTGIYINGAAPTTPSTSLAGSGIDLHSGHTFALHLGYDGTTESIRLTDTISKAVWIMNATEDIPNIVGGKVAYFGFTAGTGTIVANAAPAKPVTAAAVGAALSATANVLYWNYVNQSVNVTPIATLAPTSLNFGSVTVGSKSSVQIAKLTNFGTAQFRVASITPSDPSIEIHSSFCFPTSLSRNLLPACGHDCTNCNWRLQRVGCHPLLPGRRLNPQPGLHQHLDHPCDRRCGRRHTHTGFRRLRKYRGWTNQSLPDIYRHQQLRGRNLPCTTNELPGRFESRPEQPAFPGRN